MFRHLWGEIIMALQHQKHIPFYNTPMCISNITFCGHMAFDLLLNTKADKGSLARRNLAVAIIGGTTSSGYCTCS